MARHAHAVGLVIINHDGRGEAIVIPLVGQVRELRDLAEIDAAAGAGVQVEHRFFQLVYKNESGATGRMRHE